MLERLLDTIHDALAVVDARGDVVYANRPARHLFHADGRALGEPLRPDILDIVEDLLGSAGPCQRGVVLAGAPGEPRFRGRAWTLTSDSVALMLHPEAQREGDAARIAGGLELDMPSARLAIHVSRGLTNAEIARRLGVPESTVKGRLFELYRRLGVHHRAELAALVTARLAEDATAER